MVFIRINPTDPFISANSGTKASKMTLSDLMWRLLTFTMKDIPQNISSLDLKSGFNVVHVMLIGVF